MGCYYLGVKAKKGLTMFKHVARFFFTVAVVTAGLCALTGDWLLVAFNLFWAAAWAQMLRSECKGQ